MKKGFTPSPKGAQCFSQRSEMIGFKEVNKYFSLKQGLSGKTSRRCSAPLVRGFTLIELLVVIGILAILATATVLVLNPAQLFAQARDSQRVSDLATLRSAISFYLATVSSPNLAFVGACGTNYWGTVNGATATEDTANLPTQHANTGTTVNGNGWVPVNFTAVPGGSPLSVLPNDPANPNTAAQSYTYQCNNTDKTFEINANMESSRYACGGSDDVESTDGGDKNGPEPTVPCVYEVGNDPGLDL